MTLRDALPPHPEERSVSKDRGGRALQGEGKGVRRIAYLSTLLLCIFALPAFADELVSGLSTDLIEITSNFTGTDIVLFGAIETTESATPAEKRDVVIVISGPEADLTVRRKERIMGIWVNTKQVHFDGLPGYYFIASTRPLEAITSQEILRRFQLGTLNLEAYTPTGVKPATANEFRVAAIEVKKRERLYWESATGIEFLSQSLFRARIPVPAAVPPGQYKAEVYLFEGGIVVGAQSTPLYIDKSGLERRIFEFAHSDSLLYGVATVLMATLLGWLSYILFRQRLS